MDVYRFIRNWAARIFICSTRGYHVSGREKYGGSTTTGVRLADWLRSGKERAVKNIKIAVISIIMAFGLAACGSVDTGEADKDALPQATEETTTEATPEETKEEEKASTCDQAREAFLTGTEADIEKALKALIKDKNADATAREYADYYLNRDSDQPDLQEMDKSLIQTACSI